MKRALRILIVLAASSNVALAQENKDNVWSRIISGQQDVASEASSLARELEASGDIEGALAEYRRIADETPGADRALLQEFRLLASERRFDEILQREGQALVPGDRRNEHAQAQFFVAYAHAIAGDIELATEILKSATEFRPDLAGREIFYGNLGDLTAALGKFDEAAIFYRQAISARPEYSIARISLAITLARLGRVEDAKIELLSASLSDSEMSFVDDPTIDYLPAHERHLVRTFVAMARGENDDARTYLAEYEAVAEPGEFPEAMQQWLRRELSAAQMTMRVIPISSCTPTTVAARKLGNDTSVAVVCEDGLRYLLGGSAGTWAAGPGSSQSIYYSAMDISWSQEGNQLRMLWSNGVMDQWTIENGLVSKTEQVLFENTQIMPYRFTPSGDRILFTGTGGGGFQVSSWTVVPIASALRYPPGMAYSPQAAVTDDGEVIAVSDGYSSVSILRGPDLLQSRVVRIPGAGGAHSLAYSPGREILAVGIGRRVFLTDSTGRILNAVSLPIEVEAAITAIEWISESAIVIGTYNNIVLVEGISTGAAPVE